MAKPPKCPSDHPSCKGDDGGGGDPPSGAALEILYVQWDQKSRGDIRAMARDGSGKTTILAGNGDLGFLEPAWSPTGTHLVFVTVLAGCSQQTASGEQTNTGLFTGYEISNQSDISDGRKDRLDYRDFE